VTRHVIDRSIVTRRSSLGPSLALLVGLGVVIFATGYVRRWYAGRLSLDVQYDLRDEVFAALQRLDGARQDEVATGQLVSRASSDITLVQGLLAFLPNISGQALLFVASIVIMAALSPLLTVVVMLVTPALVVITLRSRARLFPATWSAQQRAGTVAGVVEEDVTGVRVVKGFGQEERELERLAAEARGLYAERLRAVRLTARYSPALQLVPTLGQVGVLALGGYLVLHHRLSLGTFLAFSTYLAQLAAPVRILAGLLTIGQQARAGLERVFDVLDAQPLVQEAPDAPELPRLEGLIELDDVTFGYSRSSPVLRGLSLRVEPGEVVALVGASGSGKSTVSLLLPRFYDVQGGAVRLDGHDIRDVTLASLRRGIGVVFEEAFLFSDTVAANIAYGVPDASRERVEAAARMAEADTFVRALPDGYDTVVGEQGLTLSGGQRQRVALARALLSDPRVLLLDDATSAIDARVEAEIFATLRTVMRGRTTLLVAHRRSTLDLADRIVVLAEGRVVDQGTYDELVERSELFRQLLSGPGEDAEGVDAAAAIGAARRGQVSEEQVDGVTPALWPYAAVHADRSVVSGAGETSPRGPRAGGGGGFGGGPVGNAMLSMPPTPELLAAVQALPPALEQPQVRVADAAQPDTRFGLASLLRPVRVALAAVLVLVVLDAVAGLALPALVRDGVDAGLTRHSGRQLAVAVLLALLVALGDWLVGVAQTVVTGRLGERLLFTLRVKTFAQLQRLGLDYYERELAGRIMTRMTTDVDALSSFLQTGVATAIVAVLQLVGVGVVLVVLDVELGLASLSVLPVLVVATLVFRRVSSRAYTQARERVSAVNADLQENLSGVRVAQAFTREGRNTEHFRDLADRYRDSRLRAQRAISIFFPFVQLMGDVSIAVVLGVGAHRVQDGSITPGSLIAYLLYVNLFFDPVQSLSQVFDTAQQAAVGLRRLAELLRTKTSTPPAAQPVPVPSHLRGEVTLDDVHFRYAGAREEALRGVDLRVAAGETVALVGETGAGKSTVVKLVARFYDATGGTVAVDGVPVGDYATSGYRRRLGVVPQEAFLFSGSVRDNIAYGRPEAGDAEVEAAARAVGADAVVACLGLGFLTQVGERGRSLSAGQRQLVSLARAQMVQPDVLLLDEATAALDLASEAAYLEAASALSARRTTLVVAHRLTTAQRADRVAVIDGGRVVELGTHDELLAAGGAYARLWDVYAGAPVA